MVHLEEVLEDADAVHIVMELCLGGELAHAIGRRHYSERTVCMGMLHGVAYSHGCMAGRITQHAWTPGLRAH